MKAKEFNQLGSDTESIAKLMSLAANYLDHPDVNSLPFALNPSVIAVRLRRAARELLRAHFEQKID